ncbi:MAG: polyprenyl synthetase family protein [Bacillota bacterium]|nr:polyprenyl synthetase family protein [Bacillota bacterium]
MEEIELYMTRQKQNIDHTLLQIFKTLQATSVSKAMHYSVEAGGKRLRPILVLATAETLGSKEPSVINIACALEMIHTYSLIHDDLPAMDDSDLRRGVKTCHKVYGEAVAILTGDALLTLAFKLLADYGLETGRGINALRIIGLIARAAGVEGMVGGQILDLEAEGKELSAADIHDISRLKTGALINAAVLAGAIAAGASVEEEKILERYALHIGTAFQIVDDILDYESTEDMMGKPVGADQDRLKATYPAVYGLEEAKQKAESHYNKALGALKELDKPTFLLEMLAKKFVYRTR